MSETHLITGVAGFIGRCLTQRLLNTGVSVIWLDNLSRGTPGNLSTFVDSPLFFFQKTELTDLDAFSAAVQRALNWAPQGNVTVWHLAANSDILAGVRDPSVDLRDTFLTTFNTLRVMRDCKLTRIAFASTSAIYG